MLLRRFTDIYPKELARDMREFFNSLLGIATMSSCGRRGRVYGDDMAGLTAATAGATEIDLYGWLRQRRGWFLGARHFLSDKPIELLRIE